MFALSGGGISRETERERATAASREQAWQAHTAMLGGDMK